MAKHGTLVREKINAGKRNILVDTLGLIVNLLAHFAGSKQSDNAPDFLKDMHKRRPWLRPIFADSGYGVPEFIDKLGKTCKVYAGNSQKPEHAEGSKLLPLRLIVERISVGLGRCRRLAKI
ncbi:transposase [Brucella pseudogrignonensis]|uniref:transposase n=1 Tax=Brucella pseudogrignonensis TaxID=419475 RepID=UPI0038B65436